MKNETIVDRVVERLKAQPLGDLITEADLHEIVKEAIPKAFFEKQKVNEGTGYHARLVEKDPLIVEIMRDLLQKHAKKAAEKWIADNPQIMVDYWKRVCDEGLLQYVQKRQSELAVNHIRTVLNEMTIAINEQRRNMGLTEVFFE